MRKTMLSLVGTAALLSIISSSIALQERVVLGRKQTVERGRKKSAFTQLDTSQKSEIELCMAEDLAMVMNKTPEEVMKEFVQGKTVESIVEENGLTLQIAKQKLDQLHKEKLRMKLKMCTDEKSISLLKVEQMYKKII